jgi:simple sugar transport system permease protein
LKEESMSEPTSSEQPAQTAANDPAIAAAQRDERLKNASALQRMLSRPELGAVSGLVLITIFFLSTANPAMFTAAGIMNFMAPASQLGILAVAAALLMIGGEFDLSIGSMIAFAGLIFAAALVVWQVPLIIAIILTLVFAALVGAVNAQIVLKTGLPSFIVTLAVVVILRGV